MENRLRRTITHYGRTFTCLENSLNALLETESLTEESSVGNYLSLVDTFGERNLSKTARDILNETL